MRKNDYISQLLLKQTVLKESSDWWRNIKVGKLVGKWVMILPIGIAYSPLDC